MAHPPHDARNRRPSGRLGWLLLVGCWFVWCAFAAFVLGACGPALTRLPQDAQDPPQNFAVDPEPIENPALLTLEVEPSNPSVWVDGQPRGELSRLPHPVPLPEGRHRLELRHDGYYPHRVDLTLQPNQPLTLRVRMVERFD